MLAQLSTLTGASALVLATFAITPASAVQIAPGLGAADSHVIQIQNLRDGPRGSGGPGPNIGGRGGPDGPAMRGRGPLGGEMRGRGPSDNAFSRGGPDRPNFSRRGEGMQFGGRDSGSPRAQHNRSRGHSEWHGRLTRRGWSRDRRHIFYGSILLGVPFGYYAAAQHPCYDWRFGPQGWAYYWNHYRCPV